MTRRKWLMFTGGAAGLFGWILWGHPAAVDAMTEPYMAPAEWQLWPYDTNTIDHHVGGGTGGGGGGSI